MAFKVPVELYGRVEKDKQTLQALVDDIVWDEPDYQRLQEKYTNWAKTYDQVGIMAHTSEQHEMVAV